MAYFPPTQGPGRPFGQPTPRLNEEELRQDAEAHERVVKAGSGRARWWRRLLRKRPPAA